MIDTSTPVVPGARPFLLPGSATGVLIIHGYGGSIGDYRAIADRLNQSGLTVSGLRLTGHGQGQKILRQVTVEDCQQSVSAAVAALRKTCQHVFLLGASFGGVLALDYAAHHDDVDGLILVNTALSYSGAGIFQGLILRLLRLFKPDYPKKGLSEAEKTQAASVGSSVAWPITGILATAKFAKEQVVPQLPSLRIPALIMHSQHDRIVGPDNSRRLTSLLGSARKEIQQIPVDTHRPFRNDQATAYMSERVHDFIQSVIAHQ